MEVVRRKKASLFSPPLLHVYSESHRICFVGFPTTATHITGKWTYSHTFQVASRLQDDGQTIEIIIHVL